MSSYLITGTSRGIGLELVRQLLSFPSSKVSKVIAVTRSKSQALDELISSSDRGVNVIIEDLTDETSISKSLPQIEKALPNGLDVVINNAGVSDWISDGLKSMTGKHLTNVLNNNVASIQSVTASLLPLLQQGEEKKIINISSTLGSISMVDNFLFAPTYAYKTSKAAVNMLTVLWSRELKDQGFTVITLSPGWLKTDLGTQNADLEVSVGVKSTLEIILNAGPANNGQFKNIHVPNTHYDGKDSPW